MRIRTFCFALLLSLLSTISARAQTTSVTLQVTDAAAQAWNNGTWAVALQPAPGNSTPPAQMRVNGNPVPNITQNGTLSGSGGASMTLTPNGAIAPLSSFWVFNVCPNATAICFTQSVTIVGATQTVTLTPPAPIVTPVPGPPALAYNDAEIVGAVPGSQYYNTTNNVQRICNGPAPCTWANFSGGGAGTVTSVAGTTPIVATPSPITGAGTISCPTCLTTSSTVPINNVVSATGPITPIAVGSNTLEFDCSTPSPTYCYIFGESSASTSGRILEVTTLNGSAAQAVSIIPGTAGPAGADAPNALGITGQNGGPAGASQNGFTGSGIFIAVGNGSVGGATSGNGGTGGGYTLGGGNGGAAGGSSSNNGGNGGVFNIRVGSGGNGAATGNGGNAGILNLMQAGNGVGGSGGATSGSGGNGADVNITSGIGGSAAVGSTTGRGGNITATLANAGGTGTPGLPGIFNIVGGTVAGSNTSPILNITDIWNTTGVVDAAILLNVTNTASGAGSLLEDLQVGSVSQFSVDKAGNLMALGSLKSGTDNSAAGTLQLANASANAHTIFGSAATTTNTVLGFATAPTTGHLVTCTTSGTTCTLTDGGAVPTGTVTSIATTSPITGGTITTTGTIACATCVTSSASLTANQLMLGAGLQASQVLGSLGTTTTVLHGNAASAPSFAVVTPSDAAGNTSGSGNFCLVTSCSMTTPALGTPSAAVLTNATGLPFSSLTSATNTAAAMVIGTGASLTTSGTGTIATTTQFTNSAAGALSQAAMTLSGAPITGGSGTTTFPLFYMNSGAAPTTFSTNGTIEGINAPSGFTGNFIDYHLNGGVSLFAVDRLGNLTISGNINNASITSASNSSAKNYLTASNCSGVGTAANPSVASCGSSSAGAFSCATNASTGTCQVNTTGVGANSEIFVQEDDSLGTKLGVTCNTNNVLPATAPLLGARSGGTSFTINLGTFTTNPLCYSYFIVNF